MNKVIGILVLISLLMLPLQDSAYAPNFKAIPKGEIEQVNLNLDNVVNLRGPISAASLSKVTKELHQALNKTSGTVYLVVKSPGGAIVPGEQFVEFVSQYDRIKTITIYAASMAHAIVQAIPGERLVVKSGIFMAHRAYLGGLSGQVEEGEIESRLKLWKDFIRQMEQRNADRIGISLKEYKSRVKDEWYSTAVQAVKEGVADRIVSIKCSPELINAHEEITQRVSIFVRKFKISKCPLM